MSRTIQIPTRLELEGNKEHLVLLYCFTGKDPETQITFSWSRSQILASLILVPGRLPLHSRLPQPLHSRLPLTAPPVGLQSTLHTSIFTSSSLSAPQGGPLSLSKTLSSFTHFPKVPP